MTAAPAIVVAGASKRYGDRTVLADVSLSVAPGELVALLGPNGAGKTTTVEIIEGYRRPDGGSVRVLGHDPQAGGRALRARVGIMLQGGGFDPRARPRETIVQYGQFHRSPRDPDELVTLLGLEAVARTPVKRLSGGERQRLALAVALVGRPEVAILDEPTAGMDPEARALTRGIIADLRAAGVAILLTSHDLSDVERLADRIHILDGGQVVGSGSPAELTAGAQPKLRCRLVRALTDVERHFARWCARGRHGGRTRVVAHRRPGAIRGRRRGAGRGVDRRRRSMVCVARRPDRGARRRRWVARGRLPGARRPRSRGGHVSAAALGAEATLAQVAMELRLTARRSENVLVTAIIPAVVLVFFASVNLVGGIGGDPLDFLVPGALTLAVVAASLVNLGIATGYERHYGVLKRLGGSPLTRSDLLTAKIATVFVVEALQIALLGLIAVWLGWRPGADASVLTFAAAWLLGTAAFAGLGLLLAGTLRAEATLALTNAAFIACLLLGGIVVPLDHLPAPLAAVASVLPAAALSDAFRTALGSANDDAARSFAILAAWAIGAIALTARTFRWE